MSTTTKPSYGQPALIGGAVMGVLSALPIVFIGNCCCLWIVGGGVVAAYVLQQNTSEPISPSDGALVGLLAGLAGACIHLLLSIPIDIFVSPYERQIVQRLITTAGSMPPDMRDTIERAMSRPGQAGIALIVAQRSFVFMAMLCVGSVFSTLGGLLGASLFRKSTTAGVIDIPPQA